MAMTSIGTAAETIKDFLRSFAMCGILGILNSVGNTSSCFKVLFPPWRFTEYLDHASSGTSGDNMDHVDITPPQPSTTATKVFRVLYPTRVPWKSSDVDTLCMQVALKAT